MKPLTAAAAAAALLATPILAAGPATAAQPPTGEIRSATGKYHNLKRAVADGFVQNGPCIPHMGFHFVREDRLDDEVDASMPEVLVYAPDEDGHLKLVAAEYASTAPAELFGEEFAEPDPPYGPPFYTLHAWVWESNPDGMFAAHNPDVVCRTM